jgi:hypothetical protein
MQTLKNILPSLIFTIVLIGITVTLYYLVLPKDSYYYNHMSIIFFVKFPTFFIVFFYFVMGTLSFTFMELLSYITRGNQNRKPIYDFRSALINERIKI